MLEDMNIDLDRRSVPETASSPCEHGWVTASRHATSQGVVVYVRCVSCASHRVELASAGSAMPPRAMSRPVQVA